MTVSIRPGRFSAPVIQAPDGKRRQGPWFNGTTIDASIFVNKGERILYMIHATMRERPEHSQRGWQPNSVDNVASHERDGATCVTVTAPESQQIPRK